MRKIQWLALSALLILTLSGCGAQPGDSTADTSIGSASAGLEGEVMDTSEMFTDRDFEISYDENTSAHIQLNGSGAQSDSEAVQISGSTVTITDEGTYILSGTLDGMIIVEAEDTDKIQLVLNGVDITSSTSAALYVRAADKVFITTAESTENTLANGGSYVAIDDNNIDSVIFSKSDLTLNGAGALTLQAAAGHGVVSKDDLVIASGSYTITAAGHGLSGKDSVRIAGGEFTIQAGKDGIHAENEEDSSQGFLYAADGHVDIISSGDGLSASSYLQLDGGSYTLLCGGDSAAAPAQKESGMFAISDSDVDSTSMKGIKASENLILNGGTFTVDAADDALHTNASIAINGGSFQLTTGDDGIHADDNVTISAGTITIVESYEGIEGHTIDLNGGEIAITASDDGLNAAGGNDESGFGGGFGGADNFAADDNAYISITGGKLVIDASGDGIDSNGSLAVSGGETYISGPTDGGNGALDYALDATISGGVFIAAGSSQMASNFGNSSTQGAMLVMVNSQQAGSSIALSDSGGQELISWTADKSFDSVVISCPGIEAGASYTLTAGSSKTEITMDGLIYGSASGGMGGGRPGDMSGDSRREPQR